MKTVPLSELAEINPAPGLPPLPPDAEVSFIPMSDVDERGRWVHCQTRRRSEIGPGYTAFREGDVLVAKITPCLENGKGAHAVGLVNGVGYGTTEFHVLRARARSDAGFIFQVTQDARFRLRAAAQMTGSAGQQRVPTRFFHEYEVADLTPEEQEEAARVLAQADVGIDRTFALLSKRLRLHTGLVDALMTGGIDTEGRLRRETTHAFKTTPLGRLPVEWAALPLGEALTRIEYGLSVGMDTQGDVPILRMNNQQGGEIDITDLKYVDAATAAPRLLRDGDVLFNRTNSIEHVGRTSIWRGQLPVCTFASYLLRLVPDPSKLDNVFLNEALNRGHVQDRLKQIATRAVQQANINPTNLRAFRIPVPDTVGEQRRIVAVLAQSRAALDALRSELEKLTRLKAGLMQALLSGRVPAVSEPSAL